MRPLMGRAVRGGGGLAGAVCGAQMRRRRIRRAGYGRGSVCGLAAVRVSKTVEGGTFVSSARTGASRAVPRRFGGFRRPTRGLGWGGGTRSRAHGGELGSRGPEAGFRPPRGGSSASASKGGGLRHTRFACTACPARARARAGARIASSAGVATRA